MSLSTYYLNQRISILQSEINALQAGGLPTISNLATVLTNGNSAGTTDINMNLQDILAVDNINLVTINGAAYPPPSVPATNIAGGVASQIPFQSAPSVTGFIANGTSGQYLKSNGAATPSWDTIPVIPATPTLSQVLTAGNNAGGSGINMNGQSISTISTLNTNQAGLTYLPQATVTPTSNTPIFIPAYNGDHQVLLMSRAVPVIDTLIQQFQTIGGGITVKCSAVGNGYQWLGCSNGDIYIYDTGFNNWSLVANLNGAINALFYAVGTNRLYIGGVFNTCNIPFTPNSYGDVAYIQSPDTTQIVPDNLVWSGSASGGFSGGGVNAITGNTSDNVYFGGNFNSNADAINPLLKFACYEQSTNVLTSIDNNTSNGFDDAVYNLDYLSGSICATGHFTQLRTDLGSVISPFCVIFAISGNAVSQQDALDVGASTLTTAIGGFDFIDNDGSDFYVVINQSYSSPSGTLYYLIKVSLGGFSSTLGANSIFEPITSFFRKPSTGSTHVITDFPFQNYYIDGALATQMGVACTYFTFNFQASDTVYFYCQGVGTFWAFLGNTYNNFLFSSGRAVQWFNGTVFSTGYKSEIPANGATLLLQWDGAYYTQICSLGSPTYWNPYT